MGNVPLDVNNGLKFSCGWPVTIGHSATSPPKENYRVGAASVVRYFLCVHDAG